MTGVDKTIFKSMHVKLLNLIANDLEIPFTNCADLLRGLNTHNTGGAECSVLAELTQYISTSEKVFNGLLEWNKSQLLGEELTTSHLRSQVDLLIRTLKLRVEEKQIILSNNTMDLTHASFSIPLLKLILHHLLNYSIDFADPGTIDIESSTDRNLITLSIISTTSVIFKKQQKRSSDSESFSPTDCARILTVYGGKVWFESEYSSRFKLCFSMPTIKNTKHEKF